MDASQVAMFSLNGQQSWNFFRHDWTTHLPTPLQYIRLLPPGTLKFSTVTHNIRQVGTSDWAVAGEDGFRERHPRFPYRPEILALKHESRILGHSSNPVCG